MSQFIECEACHNTLSDQATFCPKCGHPVRWKPSTTKQSDWDKTHPVFKVIGSVLVAVFFIVIALSLFDSSSTDQSVKAAAPSSSSSGDETAAAEPATAATETSPAASQLDDATATPKWIKLGDGMYVLKPFGDIPYASLVVVVSQGQRSYYFLNGGSQLCANQSDMVVKGPIGNYTVNGNVDPYEALCMGQMEFDAPMTPAGRDILRNAVESGRLVKATTSLGDDVAFDPSGLNAVLSSPASSTSANSPTPGTP